METVLGWYEHACELYVGGKSANKTIVVPAFGTETSAIAKDIGVRAAFTYPLRLCIYSTNVVASSRCRMNGVVFLVLYLLSLDDVCECKLAIVFLDSLGHSSCLCSGIGSVCFLFAAKYLLL